MFGITKYKLRATLVMQVLLFSLNAQSIITTVAGNGTSGYSGDGGQATNAGLRPLGITLDALGNLYICDIANNRIRKVNSSGVITTIAGNGTMGYSGDGGQATDAEFFDPNTIAFDKAGNLYITDFENEVIRKVITSTGIINTIAGTGTLGYSGDGGQATAAQLSSPVGIALDTAGNIYFSDEGNNDVRKITISTGIITTVVGTGTAGYNGDGSQATAAELYGPTILQFDISNNLYICDTHNSVIRKVITSTGIITTIAGNGTAGFSGDEGAATAAELNIPEGMTLDSLGNIYLSDALNNRVRKINTAGIIVTIAGIGPSAASGSYGGDGGLAINAQLNVPAGLALDSHNNLYIAEDNNYRVRKVSNVSSITGVEQYAGSSGQVMVYPNPASNMVQVAYTGSIITISVCDMLGKEVPIPNPFQRKGNSMNIDVSGLAEGVYFISIKTNEGIITKKVVVQR
jgi:sugar lactone lactonase YvrE